MKYKFVLVLALIFGILFFKIETPIAADEARITVQGTIGNSASSVVGEDEPEDKSNAESPEKTVILPNNTASSLPHTGEKAMNSLLMLGVGILLLLILSIVRRRKDE